MILLLLLAASGTSLLLAAEQPSTTDKFRALLERLGASRYEGALADEEVAAESDLRLLSQADMERLGLRIGVRNRIAAWQQEEQAPGHSLGGSATNYNLTFNVMEFGAQPSGACCSTAAINATIHASFKQGGDFNCGQGCATWGPTVLFPHGVYAINETLPLAGLMKGSGTAMIKMLDPSKDLFYATSGWRIRIEGLRFYGGNNHIRLGTNNTDCSFWVIRDCVFSGARSAAIRTLDHDALPYYTGSQSTQLTISDSQFFNNEQVLVWGGDTATLNDLWVEGSGYNASYDKAIFENHAKMILNRMLGVPAKGTGTQRWIDNHGETNAHNCRFGGESGGWAVAVNYISFACYPCDPYTAGCGPCWKTPPPTIAPWNKTMTGMGPTFNGGGLRFTECDLYSKASSFGKIQMAGAVVYFQEIPSYLVIADSMGFKECSVCGLPGEGLIRINPAIELSSEGQLAVSQPARLLCGL